MTAKDSLFSCQVPNNWKATCEGANATISVLLLPHCRVGRGWQCDRLCFHWTPPGRERAKRLRDAYWSQFQSNKSASLIHREFMFFIKMLIAIFAERSGKNAFPFGFLIWIWLYYVDDLVFTKEGQSLHPLYNLSKPTLRILPPRIWEHSSSFHRKLESHVFVSLKKNLLVQIHRGSLEYFFLQWVCFSKVNLEVLPIWLRKTGALVSAFTALSVAWKPSPPTDATRSCWCFSKAPLFASLATEKEDRVMSEVLFVLRDDSFSKSFQPRILVLLCSIHSTPSSLCPSPFYFLVLGQVFIHHLL